MRFRQARASFFWFTSVAALAACEPDPIEQVEVLPYEGDPYPSRVEPIGYPPGAVAFVTDSLSDTVSVVDLETGEKIAARPVGRNPVDLDGPHHIAIDAERAFGYIGLSYPIVSAVGPHAIHGSGVAPGWIQKLRLSDLAPVGQVRVDNNPGDIVLSHDGRRVITSHFDLLRATQNPTDLAAARSTIAVADPSLIEGFDSPAVRKITVCVAPHGMAMTQPTGSPLFVACYGEDKIAVVDLETEGVEYVDVGPGVTGFGSPAYGPYALLLLQGEPTLVVSSTASKDVRFIDTATLEVDLARTVTTLGAPYFPTVSADGTKLLVPTQQPDALLVIDLAGVEPTVTRSFSDDECDLPHAIERVGDGYSLVCEGDKIEAGKVVVLDAALEIVSSTVVGVYPDAIVNVTGVGQ
jgi:YVTN family beta-propeller protein